MRESQCSLTEAELTEVKEVSLAVTSHFPSPVPGPLPDRFSLLTSRIFPYLYLFVFRYICFYCLSLSSTYTLTAVFQHRSSSLFHWFLSSSIISFLSAPLLRLSAPALLSRSLYHRSKLSLFSPASCLVLSVCNTEAGHEPATVARSRGDAGDGGAHIPSSDLSTGEPLSPREGHWCWLLRHGLPSTRHPLGQEGTLQCERKLERGEAL